MIQDLSLFDVEAYFESIGIDYHISGEKNVGKGWIGINCPFPGCDDPSWHCGIYLENKTFSCHSCHTTGFITKLICQLEKCSYAQANSIIVKFHNPYLGVNGIGNEEKVEPRLSLTRPRGDLLPREAQKELLQLHINYLLRRRFDPVYLIDKYKITACGNLGRYKFRIIIPVYQNGRLVTFTTRDVTGKQDPKYRHQPIEQSIVPIKKCLYNLDSVKDIAVVVEGPTDVWRLGDGAVATFGTQYTEDQIKLLIDKKPKSVFVMYDEDAKDKSKKLANKLSTLGMKTEVVFLERGDPGDLDLKVVNEFRSEIGLG